MDNSQNKYQTKYTEWHIYHNKKKEHWRGKMDFVGRKREATMAVLVT